MSAGQVYRTEISATLRDANAEDELERLTDTVSSACEQYGASVRRQIVTPSAADPRALLLPPPTIWAPMMLLVVAFVWSLFGWGLTWVIGGGVAFALIALIAQVHAWLIRMPAARLWLPFGPIAVIAGFAVVYSALALNDANGLDIAAGDRHHMMLLSFGLATTGGVLFGNLGGTALYVAFLEMVLFYGTVGAVAREGVRWAAEWRRDHVESGQGLATDIRGLRDAISSTSTERGAAAERTADALESLNSTQESIDGALGQLARFGEGTPNRLEQIERELRLQSELLHRIVNRLDGGPNPTRD